MIYKNKEELIVQNISRQDVVLDIGFWGQGIKFEDPHWTHNQLKASAKEVYGIDVAFDESHFDTAHYKKMSAEDFNFPLQFDVIFASDVIEHLSNPGLFLQCCKRALKDGGKVVISTPSCFNLFNLAAKLAHEEPIMNKDETCYFNSRSLRQICRKNGLKVTRVDFLYTLGIEHRESLKKKCLNVIYRALSKVTEKYVENVVVIVEKA